MRSLSESYRTPVVVVLFLSVMLFMACKEVGVNQINDSSYTKADSIVSKWINKQIIIDDSIGKLTIDGLSFDEPLPSNGYILLRYIGRSECTSCQLRLWQYEDILAKLSIVAHSSVHFINILPKYNIEGLQRILLRDNPYGAILWLDDNDVINIQNKFPKENRFRCFLLDSAYNVMAVGDPAMSSKIFDYYVKVLSDNQNR